MDELTLATCLAYPEPPPSLLPLAHALERQNINVRFTPWQQQPQTPWLLPIAAWDYASAPEQFANWLTQTNGRFINPPGLMLWNMHKSYLKDLAGKGVSTVPTLCVPAGQAADAAAASGWTDMVWKPAVGQSGKQVIRPGTCAPPPDTAAYAGGVIIQPFMPEITRYGETCLIFFNGRFSHAVQRRPASGEWRTNTAYGASVHPVRPAKHALSAAETLLAGLPEMPVYARVDGIMTPRRFILNELELIEPALYLDKAQGAVERFARILLEKIN